MKTYKFLTRIAIEIKANNLEEAKRKFETTDLGDLYNERTITDYEFHSIQSIEEQDENGLYKPIE